MGAPEDDSTARLDRTDPNWGWEFRAENFALARIGEDEDAGQLPAAAAAALRRVVAQHSAYVDKDGTSWGRCYTCSPLYGVPCSTVVAVAATWDTHPDYPYPDGERIPRDPTDGAGTFARLHQRRH